MKREQLAVERQERETTELEAPEREAAKLVGRSVPVAQIDFSQLITSTEERGKSKQRE